MVVAVGPGNHFVPNTPLRLRAARTCYDHIAGKIAVAISNVLTQLDVQAEALHCGSGPRNIATVVQRTGGRNDAQD